MKQPTFVKYVVILNNYSSDLDQIHTLICLHEKVHIDIIWAQSAWR